MRLPLLLTALLLLAGCAAPTRAVDAAATTAPARTAPARTVTLPPAHGRFSYQIGGAYTVPGGVTIVDRDHTDAAAAGKYSICYVNAYQAQADAVAWWTAHHPQALLRDAGHKLVIDTDWDEPLLDLSTAAKRATVLGVVGGWIDSCAAEGYRAIEADNLDSYTRSHGLLTAAQALAFGRALATRAHHDHLALGQKNAADQSAAAHRAGFDFAIAEECQVYSECASYTRVYGTGLIEIEYADSPFAGACSARGRTVSVVRRDRDVTPAGDPQHVERWCG